MIWQLERMKTLEDRIRAEMEELKRKWLKWRSYPKVQQRDALQDSADARRDYLGEMVENYTERIELLDGVLKNLESKCQQNVRQLEDSSEWKEVQEPKLKLRIQGQEISELQETVNSAKARAAYGEIKGDCLKQMERQFVASSLKRSEKM